MHKEPFEIARAAFSSIELFEKHFASGAGFATHHEQVISMLRTLEKNASAPNERAFYGTLATALVKLNGQ